ncbi:GreA/GreB family elongation factor [Sphingomonas sp. MMS24-J13]|uniref:GreA/GreB family elongation factor n=1 Tax=Sphingomonas sp. MMS24-J13 TaxID=3238686 RepID=UPI00384D626B
MSVAFRRESDDEHKEPKFELPIPPGPNLVTERGIKLIEQRVAELEAKVADMAAGEALEDARRDLRYWRQRLATAQLAPPPPQDEIGFGSRVEIRVNGKPRTLQIVGDDEAHPAAGLLALSAPLAQALIGAAQGDLLPFGGRDDAIEILSIGG